MISNYFNKDLDEIFDNDTLDLNTEFYNDDNLLWNNDLMNLNSNDFNFDELSEDNFYENIMEKSKNKSINDFDCLDLNFVLKDSLENHQIKLEPTNSVSSTYLTDESNSHPSSLNSSPISGKIRKRNYTKIDSNSDTSFALKDEFLDPPKKTTKVEFIKTSGLSSAKIYKLTKDVKSEPIYVNSLTIREGHSKASYIVHKLPGGVKTVNIRPQKIITERQNESNINNFIRTSQQTNQNREYISRDYYDNKTDHYSDYRSRTNTYQVSHQLSYSNINQNHINNKNVFQSNQQTGTIQLTEEERRILISDGYSIPTRFPLTKEDERNLKKVRRKIKNKNSAQDSRRKKKEHLDVIEKKVQAYEKERDEDKRYITQLENTNKSLYSQVRHLQQQLSNKGSASATSTGLMLFMLCFALLLGGSSLPSLHHQKNDPQSGMMSSSLFYNMGYGVWRSGFNYSESSHSREKSLLKRDVVFIEPGLRPRRSILLDDDLDERHFEEVALSYSKSIRFCEQVPRLLTKDSHSSHKNKTASVAESVTVMSFISTRS